LLEAIHKVSGRDVMGDYYTRLSPRETFKGTLFDILNHYCDKTRLRWDDKDNWLSFRSTDFFNMRLKEVPDRLLEKWAKARNEKKELGVAEFLEMSRLRDDQLDASSMAEGAKALYGLEEWGTVQSNNLRPSLRFMDVLPKPLQTVAQSEKGLFFSQMGLEMQQRFLGIAYQHDKALKRQLEDGTAPPELLQSLGQTGRVQFTLDAEAVLQQIDAERRRREGESVSPSEQKATEKEKPVLGFLYHVPMGKTLQQRVITSTSMSSSSYPSTQ
jgi:hypothetical protein